MIRAVERRPRLGTLGFSITECQKAQCGIINLPLAALMECSANGYAGVRTPNDPLCQQLIGGNAQAVAAASFEADGQEFPGGGIVYYSGIEPGTTTSSTAASSDSGRADDIATTYEPPPPGPPETEAATETPATEWTEEEEEDETRNLLGDPALRFSADKLPGSWTEWLEFGMDKAKAAPWWIWAALAAAIYYTRRHSRR